jgi:hypothetical protein
VHSWQGAVHAARIPPDKSSVSPGQGTGATLPVFHWYILIGISEISEYVIAQLHSTVLQSCAMMGIGVLPERQSPFYIPCHK